MILAGAGAADRSTLSLFMAGVAANDADHAFPADDLAVLAQFPD
jgi:hypothetical protein